MAVTGQFATFDADGRFINNRCKESTAEMGALSIFSATPLIIFVGFPQASLPKR